MQPVAAPASPRPRFFGWVEKRELLPALVMTKSAASQSVSCEAPASTPDWFIGQRVAVLPIRLSMSTIPENAKSYPFQGAGLATTLDAASLGNVGAVLVDTRWPAASSIVLEHARRLGVPGVVDGEAPVPQEVVARASHVAFSAQGLAAYADAAGLHRALEIARRRIQGWTCVTDGERGVFFFEGDSLRQVLPPKVDVADTLGAGDVWHGAFALRLAEGANEEIAVRFANTAAALYCTRVGRRGGGATRNQVEALCAATYG